MTGLTNGGRTGIAQKYNGLDPVSRESFDLISQERIVGHSQAFGATGIFSHWVVDMHDSYLAQSASLMNWSNIIMSLYEKKTTAT